MTSDTEAQLPSGDRDNILLAIPLCLFRNILQCWLTTKSVAALDCACCERQLRDSFFSALKGSNLVLSVDRWLKAGGSRLLVRWILKRQIRLSSVAFAGSPSPRACAKLTAAIKRTLESTRLYNNPGLLTLVGMSCKALRCAELHSFQDRQTLSMFLFTSQNTIEELGFYSCQSKPSLHLHGTHFPRMKELTFRSSFEPEEISGLVDRCPNLLCLKLYSVSLYPSATMAPTLKYLVLENANIADSCLREAFQMLPCLECFSCSAGRAMNTETFCVLLRSCPLLTSIGLGQHECTAANLAAIGQHCVGLRRLSVCFFYNAGVAQIASVLRMCPLLTELAIRGAPLAKEDTAYAAAFKQGGRELQILDLSETQIGPELIAAVAQLPNLRELGLCRSKCESRTHSFDFIAKHAPQLRTVRIAYGTGNDTGPFTPLTCSLWETLYPRVRIVTDRARSAFWEALAFSAAPSSELIGESYAYSDTE